MQKHDESNYSLELTSHNTRTILPVTAQDSNHAQAQASDICRATEAERFELLYEGRKHTPISTLFAKLALNDFTSDECYLWNGKFTYSSPCVYLFKKRLYVKNMILRYLDIPKDDAIAKNSCSSKGCINPYHFSYTHKSKRNQKLSIGDEHLLLAFHGQGATVTQIAKALKVHRSTIYRKLNEHFHSRSNSHCNCRT